MAEMNIYRHHLSVATWIVLVSLTMGMLIRLPERVYTLWAFGSPIDFRISSAFLAGLIALAATWAGLEAALRTHPRQELLRHTYRFWGLPSAITLAGAALLPAMPRTPVLWGGVLAGVGAALAASMAGSYHTVDLEDPAYPQARWMLDMLDYLLAALAFILIYLSRSRSLVSASLIALTSGMLALDLLRESGVGAGEHFLLSALIAFILAQFTVMLNYWPFPSIRVALALLVIFYLLTGLSRTHLRDMLTPRQLIAYLALSGVAMLVIVIFPK